MEKLKKIIFTVNNDISYDQRMARICSTLVKEGYEVEIVGRRRKISVPLISKNYKQTRLSCFFAKGKLSYLELNFRLFFFLVFKKFDVVSSVDLDTILPCALVSKIKSKKIVFDAHEYFTQVPEVIERKFVKQIWETVATLCIPHVHKAYTVSETLAEIFSDNYKKDFQVIRNVPLSTTLNFKLETLNSKPQTTNHKPILLYQGTLNTGRGLEQTIEAMKNIDAALWIAGEGDLSFELRKLVDENKLNNKIKFLGYVSPDELKEITLQATIGINLLENKGLSYYYSLSNKFFDYMQAGVPQLCAPFPEYQKINEQFKVALLCDCEVSKIVESINRLLTDKIFYENLRSNCFNAREVFNWQKEENKLVKIYKDACK